MTDKMFFFANTGKSFIKEVTFLSKFMNYVQDTKSEKQLWVIDWMLRCIYVSIVPSFTMAMARLRARASRRSSVFVDSISSS